MTEATLAQPSLSQQTEPIFEYQVAMSQPTNHLFEVTLQVKNWRSPQLDLKFPVWTPGSYLVREYVRHLQDFSVQAFDETPLVSRKLSKNHWRVETPNISDIIVRYRIYANELTVRTNHLDSTHGYFNGAALFFRIPGFEKLPIQIRILPPFPHWNVTTALPRVFEKTHLFRAADFDTLVDSPFEIGTHRVYEFEVLGKIHELAIWGRGNDRPSKIMADIEKIVQVEADLFGGLPYDRYVFLLYLAPQGLGGLEHKESCSLIYPRLGFRNSEQYQRFMQLAAHEFFHLWNVKRIRPKALEVFDYDQENYTPSLWFSEGVTSYYELLIPLRAKISQAKEFLAELSKEITRFQTTPGRLVQPLSESSWDAWIKLYRQDANSCNSQMSYYLKGEMVSLLLDLLIRQKSENRRSLDDVMRMMWENFGKPEIGFTPEQLQAVLESVAEVNLNSFFERYLEGTEELPFNEYLEPFGLRLQADMNGKGNVPYLGVTVKSENGRELIKTVIIDSPAQQAGVDAGDELLAIDGIRVTADQLNERLQDYQPYDTLELTVFHQDELRTLSVTLTEPQPNRYQLLPVNQPTQAQQDLFAGWLGVPFSQILS